jgi:hypothetical protein
MALGLRYSLKLRSWPDNSAPTVAIVPGSDVLWVQARSDDGQWLQVTFGEEEVQAWADSAELSLLGDPTTLPVELSTAPAEAAGPGEAVEQAVIGTVATGTLNVREGPGIGQSTRGQLSAGDTVSVVGRSEESQWLAIAWEAGTAWVAAQYVALEAAVSSLTVLAMDLTPASQPDTVLPGKVVFQTRNGGDIYIVDGDGSRLRRLGEGYDPALSPSGAQVAYARWGSPHGVYVLDLRTGQERMVASANRPRGPTWNSDGTRLVFSHLTGTTICLATPFGCIDEETARQYLGGEDCIDTPLGRLCIDDFARRTLDKTELAQVNLEDGRWLDLASSPAAQSPHFHPVRDEILYRDRQGLQITTPTGEIRSLAAEPGVGSPVWSPDGEHIAAQMHVHDHTDIFLLDAGGTIQQQLTAPAFGAPAANSVAPSWSPDGRHIVFLSDRHGSWRLYTMNADGTNQMPFLPAALRDIPLTYEFAAERVASWGP